MAENRIRELRKAQGLTAEELGQRVGTTQVQISRLERGDRKLTLEWMMRIAKALSCAPEDLLAALTIASFDEEATPYEVPEQPEVVRALADQGKSLYVANSGALDGLGIKPSDPLLFDMSESAAREIRNGDLAIVRITDKADSSVTRTVVRQFLAPDLLTTNQRGRNHSFHLSEDTFTAEILGVHAAGKDTNSPA